jgi:hypothetical protein
MKAAHRYDGRVVRGIRHRDQCHPLDLVDCRQPLSFEWITPHDRAQKAAPYTARRQPFAQVHEPRGIFRLQRAQPHEPSISQAKSTCDRMGGSGLADIRRFTAHLASLDPGGNAAPHRRR